MKNRLQPLNESTKAKGFLSIKTFKDGVLVRQIDGIPNKVVAGSGGYGRNIIARQLAGDTTYPLTLTSISLGDNNTAASDSDTALGHSLVSGISLTDITVTNNVVEVDIFVADGALTNGTYKELGIFCGTHLFARIVISPNYTKATGEDTLFTYTLTISG